uniref:NADH-ubiquinone oxidoreductase chain 3 n=1 Tax=Histeridae sp. BMNH 1274745 TaxID=1796511 RepID=A0A126TGS2_9COLE|nr:NADH dehydrogenase subunit 3 [Histeridae sp. BMNH 1274745]
MLTIMSSSMFIGILVMIMMLAASTLSKKTITDREKSSPFECGFDPLNSPRIPFSLHFFLIAVIFLIFDVEITLLIPMIQVLKLSSMTYLLTFLSFILILIVGTLHEWNQGALNWTNWGYS